MLGISPPSSHQGNYMVSPDEDDLERIYQSTPKGYGRSLEDYVDLKILQNADALRNESKRRNLLHNWVFKWRKNQIDNTEYKEKRPDISQEAIVKHAFKWFDPFLKEQMKDKGIEPTKGGWFGDKEGHSKASKKGWITRRKKHGI